MKEFLNIAVKAGIKASQEVLKLYNEGFTVELKEDESPVTTGDLKANEVITQYLSKTPIPILSEESEKETEQVRASWQKYWCIDPIDGTKEYVNKTGEYTISIGMITPETSLLGVLAAPSMGLFYFAAEGLGSFKWQGSFEELYVIAEDENVLDKLLENSVKLTGKSITENYVFLTSRTHYTQVDEEYYQSLLKRHSDVKKIQMGSIIKAGLLAEGTANEYTKLSSASFWDVAGGHAVVKYAGLVFANYESGEEINYKNISDLKISSYTIKNI